MGDGRGGDERGRGSECPRREPTVGQEVRTGEAVAVIEAMKMQNIIRAERDGTVKAVNAKAGDSVAADEVLVEFG